MKKYEKKIECIVYRESNNGEIEILSLKRVPEDGGFWQPVTWNG
jgi:hypothetical protein